MTPDERLAELGLELPEMPATPYEPKLRLVTVHGGLAYLSGIGPIGLQGAIGSELGIEEGYEAARQTALLALRQITDALGELDRVARWLRVLGFVRSAPGFGEQPRVLNGFSDLIVDVYGEERGLCSRSAIGTSELPLGIPVEVEAIVALR
ncbi:MAG: RidA family protein [Gaiellaceae bacterium MAG52_C11]|nr:RidA family protein [Candidatus Gaiellasilicea maunaloa]